MSEKEGIKLLIFCGVLVLIGVAGLFHNGVGEIVKSALKYMYPI